MAMGNPDRSVLIYCMPGIGDTLLAFPAIRALRKAWPDAHITALTMIKSARDLLRQEGSANEVLYFDFLGQGYWRSLRFVLQLRRRKFDASLLVYPSNRIEYNLLSLLVGARKRVGHRYNHLDKRCGNFLHTSSVQEKDKLTNIEENLRLAELLIGKPCEDAQVHLDLSLEHREFASRWIADRKLDGRIIIGMHPGGSTAKNHTHKRWPWKNFVELGKELQAQLHAAILVFGGTEEIEIMNSTAKGIGPEAIAAHTQDILHTAALMEQCIHFVANDNALAHLAGALRIPATVIFGPTNAGWVQMPGAPRQELSRGLPCQPCFYYSPRHLRCEANDFACLTHLKPGQVARSVIEHIQKKYHAH